MESRLGHSGMCNRNNLFTVYMYVRVILTFILTSQFPNKHKYDNVNLLSNFI